jgi:hypothetical protein
LGVTRTAFLESKNQESLLKEQVDALREKLKVVKQKKEEAKRKLAEVEALRTTELQTTVEQFEHDRSVWLSQHKELLGKVTELELKCSSVNVNEFATLGTVVTLGDGNGHECDHSMDSECMYSITLIVLVLLLYMTFSFLPIISPLSVLR